MINEHPLMHVPRESWFLIDLMNRLPLRSPLGDKEVQLAFDTITAHWRWKDWEIEDALLRERLAALREPTLGELIDAVYRLSSDRSGKPRWGDKTPEYVTELDRLHAVFPEAQFIHIIRDARDACLSLVVYQLHGKTFRPNAKYWRDYVSAGMASGRGLPQSLYLEITYEELVLNTEQTLERVCRFLAIPYDPRMLEFHKNAGKNIAPWGGELHYKTFRPPQPDDVQRWRKEMGLFARITVEAIAGRTMDEANQVRSLTGVRRLLPMAFAVADRIAGWATAIRRTLARPFSRRSRRGSSAAGGDQSGAVATTELG
jgi:hypothetical protein